MTMQDQPPAHQPTSAPPAMAVHQGTSSQDRVTTTATVRRWRAAGARLAPVALSRPAVLPAGLRSALAALRVALPPALRQRWTSLRGRMVRGDTGMSTAEYAVGTIAAVAFAAVLYKVVTSPAVLAALQAIIARALKAPF